MIKLVYCITKKPGMTDGEFSRYWKDVHGPIGARIPGLRRLIQSHRITVKGDKYQPDYDGVAELWFDDAQSMLSARGTPEWEASVQDEVNFIDHNKVAYFVAEEHVIRDKAKRDKGLPLSLTKPSALSMIIITPQCL